MKSTVWGICLFFSNHLKQIQVCYMFAYKSLPMITQYPTSSTLSVTKNQWNHLNIASNGIMSILVFVGESFVASQFPGCIFSYWAQRPILSNKIYQAEQIEHEHDLTIRSTRVHNISRNKNQVTKNPFKQEQKWTRHESLGLEPGDINPYVRWLTGSWFQVFLMFTPIWRRFPFWLIFFNGVETTK